MTDNLDSTARCAAQWLCVMQEQVCDLAGAAYRALDVGDVDAAREALEEILQWAQDAGAAHALRRLVERQAEAA